jgi:hypothetical protein
MAVSISVVLLLLVLTALLLHNKSLRAGPAVVCVLLGFCLASTSVAPTIQSTMNSAASLVSTIRP